MKITFTTTALEKIKPILDQSNKHLKFLHDTEDCGCGMSGIPTLQLINEPFANDHEGIADPLPFYFEPGHKILYEEHMTIDFKQQTQSFILKSDGQLYSSNVRLLM